MRYSTITAALAALLLTAGTAFAHHDFALDFDANKPVTLSGAITKVEWVNPHVYVYLNAKDDQGKAGNWKVEMGSPADLTKAGWTKTTLKAGETVTLNGWRAKNGTMFANAEAMTLPSGKKLSAASSYDSRLAKGKSEQKGVGTSGTTTPAPKY